MITEILQYLRNWFVKTKYVGEFEIVDGQIRPQYSNGVAYSSLSLVNGQYIRVMGSALNDGVWKYPAADMNDESFSGAVWGLSIPPAVIALAEEITAWQEKNGASVTNPYQSESFGGYSYTKANGGSDGGTSWKTAFGSRLAPWRKI